MRVAKPGATSLSLCKFNQSVIKFNLKTLSQCVETVKKRVVRQQKEHRHAKKKKEEIIASSFEITAEPGQAALINFSGMQKATSFLHWLPSVPAADPFFIYDLCRSS